MALVVVVVEKSQCHDVIADVADVSDVGIDEVIHERYHSIHLSTKIHNVYHEISTTTEASDSTWSSQGMAIICIPPVRFGFVKPVGLKYHCLPNSNLLE